MALHDPESTAQERQLAHFYFHQIIDGQQVEVIDDEEDEGDDETQVLAVEGEDGQQYVVLEVIHLQDGDGTEQTVAVVGDDTELGTETVLADATDMGDLGDPNLMAQLGDSSNDGFQSSLQEEKEEKKIVIKSETVTENDVKTCFGFDDDDEDEQEQDEEMEEYY